MYVRDESSGRSDVAASSYFFFSFSVRARVNIVESARLENMSDSHVHSTHAELTYFHGRYAGIVHIKCSYRGNVFFFFYDTRSIHMNDTGPILVHGFSGRMSCAS